MIYTLVLPTQYVNNPGSVTSNAEWNVNWDDLFNKENHNYKNCRIRIQIQSLYLQQTSNSATAVTDGTWEYENRTGFISCNLASHNQGTALINNQNQMTGGTILGLIAPNPIMSYATSGSSGSVANYWISYQTNTLNTKGVEVVTPTGFGTFRLSFYNFISTGTNQPQIMNYDKEFICLLQFELGEDD